MGLDILKLIDIKIFLNQRNMEKKVNVKIPKYSESKHASAQTLSAQRLPARTYKDCKKEAKKRQCRKQCGKIGLWIK